MVVIWQPPTETAERLPTVGFFLFFFLSFFLLLILFILSIQKICPQLLVFFYITYVPLRAWLIIRK